MAKVVTMKDIADSLGISKATVSLAFNSPEKIKSETHKKIMDKARELEYLPNPAAKRLSIGKNYTVGFLLPQSISRSLDNPYAVEVLKGIGAECEKRGYTVLIIPPLKSSIRDALMNAAVDGIIAMGVRFTGSIKDVLMRRHIPAVSIDGRKSDGINSINIDDESAAYEQMKYVLGHGHRNILVIELGRDEYDQAECDEDSTGERRLKGYGRALKEAGLSIDDVKRITCTPGIEDGKRAFEKYYDLYKPTAIISMSDAVAFGIIKKAREKGIGIPKDLSIIGFDGLSENYFDFTLSTVRQPAYEKGSKAAELLFSAMDDDGIRGKSIYVDYCLIEGESVRSI